MKKGETIKVKKINVNAYKAKDNNVTVWYIHVGG